MSQARSWPASRAAAWRCVHPPHAFRCDCTSCGPADVARHSAVGRAPSLCTPRSSRSAQQRVCKAWSDRQRRSARHQAPSSDDANGLRTVTPSVACPGLRSVHTTAQPSRAALRTIMLPQRELRTVRDPCSRDDITSVGRWCRWTPSRRQRSWTSSLDHVTSPTDMGSPCSISARSRCHTSS